MRTECILLPVVMDVSEQDIDSVPSNGTAESVENGTKRLPRSFSEDSARARDYGGPRKEFFALILRDIKKKYFDLGLREHLFFDYTTVGSIMGLSMLQNGKLPQFLSEYTLSELLHSDPSSCIVKLRDGLSKLGIYQLCKKLPSFCYLLQPNSSSALLLRKLTLLLTPSFSPEGSNSRMQEGLAYSALLKYIREVADVNYVICIGGVGNNDEERKKFENDVNDFRQACIDSGIAEYDKICIIPGEKATIEEIERVSKELVKKTLGADRRHNVILYYSGHCTPPALVKLLCSANSSLDGNDLLNLSASKKAIRRLYILDACNAMQIFMCKVSQSLLMNNVEIMTSSGTHEDAAGSKSGDSNSVFTRILCSKVEKIQSHGLNQTTEQFGPTCKDVQEKLKGAVHPNISVFSINN